MKKEIRNKKPQKTAWGVILNSEEFPFAVSNLMKLHYVPSMKLWAGDDTYLICGKLGFTKKSSRCYVFSSISKKEVKIWKSGAETFKDAVVNSLLYS